MNRRTRGRGGVRARARARRYGAIGGVAERLVALARTPPRPRAHITARELTHYRGAGLLAERRPGRVGGAMTAAGVADAGRYVFQGREVTLPVVVRDASSM